MTEEEALSIGTAIGAADAISNCLIRFLEMKDIIQRKELIIYLESVADSFQQDGANERLVRAFRTKIANLESDRGEPQPNRLN